MTQKWKTDPSLHACSRVEGKKDLDYYSTYKDEFLESDPVRDWESIDRCKKFWNFCLDKIDRPNVTKWRVLDCGTKDGQFPEFLVPKVQEVIGIELSDNYVEYAQSKGRPVIKGDVCNLDFPDNSFDFVFSHHLLGLVPDYFKGLTEMFRVIKPGGYLATLNDVPGNPKKHYCLIESTNTYTKWLTLPELNPHKIRFHGRWNDSTEWILFLQKQ